MRESGPYSVMPRPAITRGDYHIAAIEPEAIESVRQWRNAQIEILRQMEPITPDQQIAYFQNCIWPEKDLAKPSNLLVSFFEKGRLVGYGGLVHLAWEHKRAEISFLLDPMHEADVVRRSHLLAEFLELIKIFAFEDLGLRRLTTETYATRAHIIPVLEAGGFQREGVLRGHVIKNGVAYDATLHACLAHG